MTSENPETGAGEPSRPSHPWNPYTPKTAVKDGTWGMPEWFRMTLAALGGLTSAFVVVMAGTLAQYGAMRGQLVAGDPETNAQLPTLFNAFHSTLDGSNPMFSAMSSYLWWLFVLVVALPMTWLTLKLVRRFVG